MAKSRRPRNRHSKPKPQAKGPISKRKTTKAENSVKKKQIREPRRIREAAAADKPGPAKVANGKRKDKQTRSTEAVKIPNIIKTRSADDKLSVVQSPAATAVASSGRQTRSSGISTDVETVKSQAPRKSVKRKSSTNEITSVQKLTPLVSVKEGKDPKKVEEPGSKPIPNVEEPQPTTAQRQSRNRMKKTPSKKLTPVRKTVAEATLTHESRVTRRSSNCLTDVVANQKIPTAVAPVSKRSRRIRSSLNAAEPDSHLPPLSLLEPMGTPKRYKPKEQTNEKHVIPKGIEDFLEIEAGSLQKKQDDKNEGIPRTVSPTQNYKQSKLREFNLPIEKSEVMRRLVPETPPRSVIAIQTSFEFGCQFPETGESIKISMPLIASKDQGTQVGTPLPIPLLIKVESADEFMIPVSNLETALEPAVVETKERTLVPTQELALKTVKRPTAVTRRAEIVSPAKMSIIHQQKSVTTIIAEPHRERNAMAVKKKFVETSQEKERTVKPVQELILKSALNQVVEPVKAPVEDLLPKKIVKPTQEPVQPAHDPTLDAARDPIVESVQIPSVELATETGAVTTPEAAALSNSGAIVEPLTDPIPEPPPRRPRKVFAKTRGMKEIPSLIPEDTGPPPKPGGKEILIPIEIVSSLKRNGSPKSASPEKPSRVDDLAIPTPLFNLDDLNLAGEVELVTDDVIPVYLTSPRKSEKLRISETISPENPRKRAPPSRTSVLPASPRRDKWLNTPSRVVAGSGSAGSPKKIIQHQPQLVSELVTNMIKANLPIRLPTMDADDDDDESEEEELLDLDESPSNYFIKHSIPNSPPKPKPPPRSTVSNSNDFMVFHADIIPTNAKPKTALPASLRKIGVTDESDEEELSDMELGTEFSSFKPLPCSSTSNGSSERLSSCRSRIQKVRDRMKQKSIDKQDETDTKTPPIFRNEIYPLKKPPSVKDIMDWKRKLTPEQECENAQRVPALRYFLNKSNPVKYPLAPGDNPRQDAIAEMLEAVARIRAATEEIDRRKAKAAEQGHGAHSSSVIFTLDPEVDAETRRRSIRWKSPMVASKVIPDQFSVPLDNTQNGEQYSCFLPSGADESVVTEAAASSSSSTERPDYALLLDETERQDDAIPTSHEENVSKDMDKPHIESKLVKDGDDPEDENNQDNCHSDSTLGKDGEDPKDENNQDNCHSESNLVNDGEDSKDESNQDELEIPVADPRYALRVYESEDTTTEEDSDSPSS